MSLPSVDWWPQGPLGTFLLFLMPIGPAKPAGIMAGKNAELSVLVILALYLAKDIVMAMYLEPLYRLVRHLGGRQSWGARLGSEIAELAARFRLGTSRSGLLASLFLIGMGAAMYIGGLALHNSPVD